MMLIDTHAHVNFNAFKDDGEEVLKRSLKEGVSVINVGSQYSTSARAVEYAHKFESEIWAAVGIHPVHLVKRTIEYKDPNELQPEEINPVRSKTPGASAVPALSERTSNGIKTSGEEFDREKYLELARDPKTVAIGEVGLDYHHFEGVDNIGVAKKRQKEIFLKFIELANEVDKPVMLHCWDAYDDLYEILKNNPVKKWGVVHSFVGGWKTARKFTELGYKIGLNGIVTYSESYDRLIKELALEDILLETDCPYLSPAPKKGERNVPPNVLYVAEKIAQIKQISVKEVAQITTQNAKHLFEI